MMFCASAGSSPARTVSTLMPIFLHLLDTAAARGREARLTRISRGLKTTSPDFRPNSLIIRLPSS